LAISDMLLAHSSGLRESKWLLSVPVVAGGGDGEAGVWVDKWLLGLGKGEWLLTVPVVSSSSDGKASIWVDKRI
jgi:hypothetical protein